MIMGIKMSYFKTECILSGPNEILVTSIDYESERHVDIDGYASLGDTKVEIEPFYVSGEKREEFNLKIKALIEEEYCI